MFRKQQRTAHGQCSHAVSVGTAGAAPCLFGESASLRQFIPLLDDAGLLVRATEPVHWRFAIGRMTREVRKPLLFENIIGYPGQRVFTNGLSGNACLALALGMDLNSTRSAIPGELRRRLSSPLVPRTIEIPGVPEDLAEARDPDLTRLPIPHWSELDGGRYLGTWHINVSKDPETGARNAGVYRMQLLDGRHATVNALPGSHLAMHVDKAERYNRPLRMGVAIGVPEAVVVAAAAGCPAGKDEFELAGMLLQRPVELIRCPGVDLEVPAASEIVATGIIHPRVRVQDGPFFDYMGVPNTNPEAFLFEVTRLWVRNEPIFRGASVGTPGAEDHQLFSLLAELGLLDFHGSRLRRHVQTMLFRRGMFRALQQTSRAARVLRLLARAKGTDSL